MKRNKLRYSIWCKTLAFIILIFSVIAVPLGSIGTYYLAEEGLYLIDGQTAKEKYLDEYFEELGKGLLYSCHASGERYATAKLKETSVYYQVKTPMGEYIGNYSTDIDVEWSKVYQYTVREAGSYSFQEIENYTIELFAPVQKEYPDYVALVCFVGNYTDLLKVLLPLIAVGGFILTIASFVYLMCAAGWRHGKEEVTSGIFGWIPTDIFTVLVIAAVGWLSENLGRGSDIYIRLLQSCCLILLIIVLAVGYFTSIAARVKAGTVWKSSIIGWIGKWIIKLFKMLYEVVSKLPMIWKTACIVLFFTIGELLGLVYIYNNISYTSYIRTQMPWLVGLWVLEKLIIVFAILFITLRLKDLQQAGKKLAEGDLNYKVDTALMFGDIRQHGENLNCISEGVSIAVNERMKSEHLKTELITNVSHDIKTPLTSIINYSDLIEKEETDNEKIKEYADVLHRQSVRLKKLIEDLVDASKASTGNIDVNLEPCQVGVLLEQAAGEFEQRLYEKNIDLICKQPEETVNIMADPKLLWRVFDNLMTNICKYAQNGTRVYLTVEKNNQKAVITFKNISEYPLDISADELMERFVRGDRSRHTEGNGLGLNIARSLTELQNGTLELVIDGDLFKVLLSFPINSNPIN